MRDRLLAAEKVKAIDWRDGTLFLLDQRVLPFEQTWIACTDVSGVAEAIRSMQVRGASAIGIAAAYGMVLAVRARIAEGGDWYAALEEDFALLADARPTAAHLFWSLNRMHDRLARRGAAGRPERPRHGADRTDRAGCRGEPGQGLINLHTY